MSVSLNCSTSRLSPAKKKGSPGASVEAKPSSTVPSLRPLRKRTVEQRLLDDDAGVHPVLLGDCGLAMRHMPPGSRHQPAELVVGLQRIAAGRDEVEDLLERLLLEARHKARRSALRRAARPAGTARRQAMARMCWASTSSAPGRKISGSSSPSSIASSAARASRYSKRLPGTRMPFARLVEPVVGAADPLQQARAALGRAHLDDEVDVAPVDAEVEAGGRDQPAQLARRHRRLDLAPRLDRQAAVVDADRQRLVVDRPQVLEDQLGEAARVAEDERRLVLLDQPHHLARPRGGREWPRPGDAGSRGSGSRGRARRRDRRGRGRPAPCRHPARASRDRRRDR